MLDWHIMGKVLVSDGEKTVDIYQTSFYTNHVKKTRGAWVPRVQFVHELFFQLSGKEQL